LNDLRRFNQSLKFAFKGLSTLHKSERNFRIQTFIGLIVLVIALFMDINEYEVLWLSFSVMLVLLMEGLNTVVEKMLDLLYPEYNALVGKIKDISAAVVLIAAVFSIVAGITIFGKVLFKFNPKYGIIVAVVFILLIKALSPKGGE
jgi:diacylglycerol kinase (ATP)